MFTFNIRLASEAADAPCEFYCYGFFLRVFFLNILFFFFFFLPDFHQTNPFKCKCSTVMFNYSCASCVSLVSPTDTF